MSSIKRIIKNSLIGLPAIASIVPVVSCSLTKETKKPQVLKTILDKSNERLIIHVENFKFSNDKLSYDEREAFWFTISKQLSKSNEFHIVELINDETKVDCVYSFSSNLDASIGATAFWKILDENKPTIKRPFKEILEISITNQDLAKVIKIMGYDTKATLTLNAKAIPNVTFSLEKGTQTSNLENGDLINVFVKVNEPTKYRLKTPISGILSYVVYGLKPEPQQPPKQLAAGNNQGTGNNGGSGSTGTISGNQIKGTLSDHADMSIFKVPGNYVKTLQKQKYKSKLYKSDLNWTDVQATKYGVTIETKMFNYFIEDGCKIMGKTAQEWNNMKNLITQFEKFVNYGIGSQFTSRLNTPSTTYLYDTKPTIGLLNIKNATTAAGLSGYDGLELEFANSQQELSRLDLMIHEYGHHESLCSDKILNQTPSFGKVFKEFAQQIKIKMPDLWADIGVHLARDLNDAKITSSGGGLPYLLSTAEFVTRVQLLMSSQKAPGYRRNDINIYFPGGSDVKYSTNIFNDASKNKELIDIMKDSVYGFNKAFGMTNEELGITKMVSNNPYLPAIHVVSGSDINNMTHIDKVEIEFDIPSMFKNKTKQQLDAQFPLGSIVEALTGKTTTDFDHLKAAIPMSEFLEKGTRFVLTSSGTINPKPLDTNYGLFYCLKPTSKFAKLLPGLPMENGIQEFTKLKYNFYSGSKKIATFSPIQYKNLITFNIK